MANSNSDELKPKSEDMPKDEEVSEETEEETESMDDTEEETAESMDDEEKPESAASIAQLRKAFPNASADFILESVEASRTIDQARTAHLEQTVTAQAKQIDELKANQAATGVKPLGTVKTADSFTGDAKAQWKAELKKKTDAGVSRAVAVKQLSKEQPDLHAAYVAASN